MKLQRKQKNIIFYCLMLAWPVLQLSVFYIYVNFNSVIMSFQQFDVLKNSMSFYGFNNYIQVFKDIRLVPELQYGIRNSFIVYAFSTVTGMFLGLFSAYYSFKKRLLGNVFKVILFSPSVISSVVLVTMFLMLVEEFLPSMINKYFGTHLVGFLNEDSMRFPTLIIYGLWVGLGTQILMYLGAMNNISESTIEAAQLDGITPIKEFFIIVLPQISSTVFVFVTTGLAGVFVNQLNLYTFFAKKAPTENYTVGYYMYLKLLTSSGFVNYPYVAAMGIIISVITTPVVILTRKLLKKIDPMEN